MMLEGPMQVRHEAAVEIDYQESMRWFRARVSERILGLLGDASKRDGHIMYSPDGGLFERIADEVETVAIELGYELPD